MQLHQVTILWNGCEIGYGEAESYSDARAEAIESVDAMYESARLDWTFSHVKPHASVDFVNNRGE